MSKIRGKIQQGVGKSQATIREQLPYFKNCFPEVAECHPGTINILLEQPLVIITPDYTSEPLPWHPAFKVVKNGEIFRFLRIRLCLPGREPIRAWVYKAQFSPYRNNPFYIEVLAPLITYPGEAECEVEILSQCYSGVVVIGAAETAATGKHPA